MKSLMSLLHNMLVDSSMWCCTSATRDWLTISSRIEHEGMSFLTITLPTFCSDFERALDIGRVTHDMFPSFKKHAGLPRLFGGFLELVFDRSSGLLLEQPSLEAIFFVRQLTLFCKKILLPCSSERQEKAFESYIQCERDVAAWDDQSHDEIFSRFDHCSSLLWSRCLSDIDLLVSHYDHVPKHGPGKTADRLLGNEKYRLNSWTERLEENYFPSADFAIPNYGHVDFLSSLTYLEPGAELPVKVVSVPKTLKTPRIIAIEPTCMQYAQQALMEQFVVHFERDDILKNMIGFTDQTPNQRMARDGSLNGRLATIDLSEASDRVSNQLVCRLLKHFPHLASAVQASRSLKADVPGYGVVPLSKFASMGSATCFPVEAMVFLTICFVGIERTLNRPLRKSDISRYMRRVRVYGDDIIVPVKTVRSVVESLEDFGLRVNSKKSFWTGRFRESCGRDYYGGEDVTVTYCRRMLPERLSNVAEMVSAVSLRNQLYKAGFWRGAAFLDEHLRRLAPLPNVNETSPVLGRQSFLGYTSEKLCANLHSPLVKGLVIRPVPRKSFLDGSGALQKYFLKRGFDPFFDVKHLERYGRPEHVDIKVRWGSPF